MQRLFIYGDSNVYGTKLYGFRVRFHNRWVNRLQTLLGDNWEVLHDGVPGRIAGNYRTDKPQKNGQQYYQEALTKANPDIIIVALGTNDLQQRFRRTVPEVVADLLWYRQASGQIPVIYLLPTHFERIPEFTDESEDKMRQLHVEAPKSLGRCIELHDIPLSDGLHFSPKGHKKVAETVAASLYASASSVSPLETER